MAGPNDLHSDEEDVLPDFRPMRPSEGLRARVLASIEPASRFEGFVARMVRLFDLSELRAREVLAVAATVPGPGWVGTPLPGLHLHHFDGGPRVASADCGLVHLASGTAFPTHRHLGREWNLVLAGSADAVLRRERILLAPSPLCPFRTGRQPSRDDRTDWVD